MKRFIITQLFISLLLLKVKATNVDSLRPLLNIRIAENALLKDLSILQPAIIHDTLFILNHNKLVLIDFKQKNVSTNEKVNATLAGLAAKKQYPLTLSAAPEGFYIGCWDGIRLISTYGKILSFTKTEGPVDYIHSTIQKIWANFDNKVITIDKVSGAISQKVDENMFTSVGGYITIPENIGVCRSEGDVVKEFTMDPNQQLNEKEYEIPESYTFCQDPYYAFADQQYFIIYDLTKRDALYFLDKNNLKKPPVRNISMAKYQLIRTIALRNMEEDDPKLKIGYADGKYYLLSWKNGNFQVFTF
ncbi:hypothetical protein SAMN05444266_11516 [Chitinophaga jiangningensis]|uniref:TolB-like 6-blade propeller-like n=1 Tax=Chitinophaga jiangningensis TaxID=1419482 RepID=A0A1M7MWL4_9BACT|nr:hypothetical protein [Chitinophaga jiangningensis]SHM94997.1 hypothetical protein SAMN05444266_11516 [Chitinophaga jiangningensis]